MQKIRFATEVFGIMIMLLLAVLIQCTYHPEKGTESKNRNAHSGSSMVKRNSIESKSSTGLLKLMTTKGPVQKIYF